jgi:hypothetical protein
MADFVSPRRKYPYCAWKSRGNGTPVTFLRAQEAGVGDVE